MGDELPRRIELIYQDAVENIRFFKAQQWTITNYAFFTLTNATLVALAQLTIAPRWVFIIAVWAAFVYHSLVMRGLALAVRKFRRRVRWIYEHHFPSVTEDAGLKLVKDKGTISRLWYVRFLVISFAIAAGLATFAICTLKLTPSDIRARLPLLKRQNARAWRCRAPAALP